MPRMMEEVDDRVKHDQSAHPVERLNLGTIRTMHARAHLVHAGEIRLIRSEQGKIIITPI